QDLGRKRRLSGDSSHLLSVILVGSTTAISVRCPTKRYIVILFQPVTLTCEYQTSSIQPPVVTWRYKSYCRDPIQAALNPSSAENILSQNNPNYDPNIECGDSQRTVRIVASKQGNAVSLGQDYQGRKISILNQADLNIAQTAWGDSGVYVCSVVSAQDLTGNSEDYTELIVLDWLLVVVVILGFVLLLILIGICWCQCCPHTCCCYISCPCCPERCCCPRALYEAGKAVKKGVSSQYAPTLYAPSMYAQPAYVGGMSQPGMPLLPLPNGIGGPPQPNSYSREYDRASSVGQGSQVPLLHDQDNGGENSRSGYRIQVDPDGNATRAIYYMERELANLDPSRPSNYNRLDGMSEVSSLHDNLDPRGRGGRSQPPPLATVYDGDEGMSTISSVSQQAQRRGPGPSGGYMGGRARARSMDNLDDIGHRYSRDDYPPQRRNDGPRGRRGSDDEWSTSARGGYDRDFDDRRRRDYSPDDRRRGGGAYGGLQGRRSRSRDDLMDLERAHQRGGGARGGRDAYDDSFLREAMERKKMGEQQRARSRERLDSESDRSDRGRGARGPPPLPVSPPSGYPGRRDDFPPPPPPPYSEDESVSSSKRSNLRKNGAVSRESLVV
uniref:Lipolysis stimulated lipoprotein receptor n=1 Tax=Myripristis murdjan TaxID=586833 RepID=A0A667WLE2_9TELE